jgi:hypothetical protein
MNRRWRDALVLTDAELEPVTGAFLEASRVAVVDLQASAPGPHDRCGRELEGSEKFERGRFGMVNVDVEHRDSARAADDSDVPFRAPPGPAARSKLDGLGFRRLPCPPDRDLPVAAHERPAEAAVGACVLDECGGAAHAASCSSRPSARPPPNPTGRATIRPNASASHSRYSPAPGMSIARR